MNFVSRIFHKYQNLRFRILHATGLQPKTSLADEGELLARKYLKLNGYKILETGWRWHRFELDIIAKKDNIVAFIEVKTRSSLKFGMPQEAVNKKKQKHIKSASKAYIQQKRLFNYITRFDIVEVLLISGEEPEINHLENAF